MGKKLLYVLFWIFWFAPTLIVSSIYCIMFVIAAPLGFIIKGDEYAYMKWFEDYVLFPVMDFPKKLFEL